MSYTSAPWPAVAGSPSFSADNWRNVWAWMGRVSKNPADVGVLGTSGHLLVTAGTFPTVNISAGAAMIDGRFAESNSSVPLTHDSPDPTYHRIDLVVFRTNTTTKTAELAIKKGTAGPTPTAPTPVQDHSPYYELPLFEVTVRAAATGWEGRDFKDVRKYWGARSSTIIPVYLAGSVSVTRGWPIWMDPNWAAGGSSTLMVRGMGDYSSASPMNYPLLGLAIESGNVGDVIGVMMRGPMITPVTQQFYVGEAVFAQYLYGGVPVITWEGRIGQQSPYSYTDRNSEAQFIGTAMNNVPSGGGLLLVYVDALTVAHMPRIAWIHGGSTDYSLTTSWAAIAYNDASYTEQNLSHPALAVRSQYLRVTFSGTLKHATAGSYVYISLAVDNTPISGLGSTATPPILAVNVMRGTSEWLQIQVSKVIPWLKYATAAGIDPLSAHNFSPALRSNASGGTLSKYGVELPNWYFEVQEVWSPNYQR